MVDRFIIRVYSAAARLGPFEPPRHQVLPLGAVKLESAFLHFGQGALNAPVAYRHTVGRNQNARAVIALLAVHQHRVIPRITHQRHKLIENLRRYAARVRQPHMLKLDRVPRTIVTLAFEPPATQRMSRAAASADDGAQAVGLANVLEMLQSRLPATQ